MEYIIRSTTSSIFIVVYTHFLAYKFIKTATINEFEIWCINLVVEDANLYKICMDKLPKSIKENLQITMSNLSNAPI